MYRRSSVDNLQRLDPNFVRDRVTLHKGDITDIASLGEAIWNSLPTEIYNEADQDNVDWSFQLTKQAVDVTYGGVSNLLEVIRWHPMVKVFQPLSAMMFGTAPQPQNERTPFAPMSPYACAKVAAYYLCRYYREAYGVFVSTAIFFNHDSPRRSGDYLLHKICSIAKRISNGEKVDITFDVDQLVDIGLAHEYMVAAHSILQLEKPDDFVIGTGNPTSIGTLLSTAFTEYGMDPQGWREHHLAVKTPYRPGGTPVLVADCSKARAALGWEPTANAIDVLKLLAKANV